MRTTVLLAMLPLALAATLLPEPKSPYTGVKKPLIAAHADSFRERFEAVYPTHTFAQRWWPGEGLTFDQRWSPIEFPGPVLVRTITITKPPPEPPHEAVADINTAVPPPTRGLPQARPPHGENSTENRINFLHKNKSRPIRVADICARHGMHKAITNGGRSWRCRK